MEATTKVYIINGEMEGESFDVHQDSLSIGRGADNDLQINDASISRNHAKILKKGEKFFIQDLHSKNGTWLYGSSLNPGDLMEVKEGMPVGLGKIMISLASGFEADGMVTQYAIDLSDEMTGSRRHLFYRDRRFTSRRNLELIYEVTTVLMQTLDLNEICKRIMKTLFLSFKRIDNGAILLLDEESNEPKSLIEEVRDEKRRDQINYSRTIVNRVIREGRAVIMSDTSQEARENISESMEMMRVKSVMCAPLITTSKIRGAIYLHSANKPYGFRHDDLFLLTALSSPAALAIENAVLHTQRRQAEEELLKAKKLESIGNLAGGIAHDYNNLLTTIMGNISLAQTYFQPDHKAHQLLNRAQEASQRAKDLTQRLITFSRGGSPVVRKTHIPSILISATEFVLSGSNVKCVFDLPEDLWAAEVDQAQINQVVHNLVINAREAMPEGGDVRVSAENVHLKEDNPFFLRQGRYVKISFEDQGRGIPSDHLERIFDPYFSTKQMGNQRGMGLGLAISHSIIKKHRGHIAVESEVGRGSSFQVYLPVAEKPVGDETARPERRSSRKYKILVMDDEKLVRDVVSDVLHNAGFEVFAAENGERALQLYLEASRSDVPFDAVILDLTVKGGMGGREVINKMLQIDPEVKGIVSSGYFDDPSITDFRQFGFKGAIAKPYNVDELEKTIYQVINKDSI